MWARRVTSACAQPDTNHRNCHTLRAYYSDSFGDRVNNEGKKVHVYRGQASTVQKIIFKPPIISCFFVFFLAFGVHGEVIRRGLRDRKREGGRTEKGKRRRMRNEAYGGASISAGTRVTSGLVQGPSHGVILLYRKPMMTVFRCWLARFKNTPATLFSFSLHRRLW